MGAEDARLVLVSQSACRNPENLLAPQKAGAIFHGCNIVNKALVWSDWSHWTQVWYPGSFRDFTLSSQACTPYRVLQIEDCQTCATARAGSAGAP